MLTHVLVIVATLLAPTPEHQEVVHTDTQEELLHFATATQAMHQHFASVWPKFWDESTPFIVYNLDGNAILFTLGAPIPGYQQLADDYYYYSERLPNITDFHFYINYPLPNDQAATAALLSDGSNGVIKTRELLLHEAFHGYQQRAFAATGRSDFMSPDRLDEATTRAMVALQFALAKKAHESRERAHIHDWLVARVALATAIEPQVAVYLGDVERTEGTAHWVGLRAALDEHYRDSIDNFSRGFETPYGVRFSAYVTGAILIDLIDEFSEPGHNWRQAIEQGKTPYELALRLFSVSNEDALAQLDDVLARHNFAEYITQAQAASSNHATLTDIESSYPYRLEIIMRVADENELAEFSMSFNQGEGGFHQLSPGIIFLPDATLFQWGLKDSAVEVRNMPVLMDMSDPTAQGLTLIFWSHSPITTLDELRNMHELALQFGDSSVQSPAGWALVSDSTPEHLMITLSSQSDGN